MVSIAQRLRQALNEKNMKQSDLAEMTGIGKSSISTYLSGEYEPKQRNIYKMAKALNVNEAWLMGEDVPSARVSLPSNIMPLPKTYKVPLLGTIACGDPILAVEEAEETADVPEDINADFALRCKGDSMINAGIRDGDIVYIRQQETVENGEIAAVMVGDEEATLKRFKRTGDTVLLIPENSSYDPLVFRREEMNTLRIVGKVVGYTHMFW